MDYNSLDDCVHALRNKRDFLEAVGREKEAERIEDQIEAINVCAGHVRSGSKLPPAQAAIYLRQLLNISAPSDIQAIVPFHRWNAVYNAIMKLAQSMERVKAGKPARKWFGIL